MNRRRTRYENKNVMQTRNFRAGTITDIMALLKRSVNESATESEDEGLNRSLAAKHKSIATSASLSKQNSLLKKTMIVRNLVKPKKMSNNGFTKTQYSSRMLDSNLEEAKELIKNFNYLEQQKSIRWVSRMFVEIVGLIPNEAKSHKNDDFDLHPVERLVLSDDEKEYINEVETNGEETKFIAREVQVDVVNAINKDFRGQRTRSVRKLHNEFIEQIIFSRVGSNSQKLPQRQDEPFSVSFFSSRPYEVEILIKFRAGILPSTVKIPMNVHPQQRVIRVADEVRIPICMNEENKILIIRKGFETIFHQDAWMRYVFKWRSVKLNIEKQKGIIPIYPKKISKLSKVHRGMIKFLEGKQESIWRFSLGAIGVDLIKGVKTVEEMNLEKHLKDGLNNLYYVEYNQKNKEDLKQVWRIMSAGGRLEDRLEKLTAAGLENPWNYSTNVPEVAIDYFISHSWSDDIESKLVILDQVATEFEETNGRPPRFWIDCFCMNQDETSIAQCVELLPFFQMACNKLLVLYSESWITRLWCLVEILTRHLLRDKGESSDIVIKALDNITITNLTADIQNAKCADLIAEKELRNILDNIPGIDGSDHVQDIIQEALSSSI